tara:strand:+ start:355 stop:804 length:450 start_codon:yes stop_codon:yes gene_type:complete
MKKMHAISGNKQFMTKRAIPLLKKYGIQKSRANLIGGKTLELRFLIDDDKLERINKELKKMNRTAYDGIMEQLRKVIREEIKKLSEGGMGILGKDQADILQAIVMRNKNKNSKAIFNLVMKTGHFKGVDKKEMLGYIEGAKMFAKYMRT